jgi:hypothetical protein
MQREEDNPYNAGGQLVLDSGLYQHPTYYIFQLKKKIKKKGPI